MSKDNRSKLKQQGSLEEDATLNLWRTADQLQIHFTRLFREHGLTPQQYNVLRILRGAPGPLPCLDIASRLITAVPAITGLIDRLDEAGLIARERSATDRRVVYVSITAAGKHRLKELDEPVQRLHKALLGHMDEAALRSLIALAAEARRRAGGDGG